MDDFYEDDEDPDKVRAAFELGEKNYTGNSGLRATVIDMRDVDPTSNTFTNCQFSTEGA